MTEQLVQTKDDKLLTTQWHEKSSGCDSDESNIVILT
jgi:hypothetical protein